MHELHRPLRVAFIAPSIAREYGGPTTAMIGYARAASAAGIKVHVLAPRPTPAEEEWFRAQLPGADVTTFRCIGRTAFVFAPELLKWLQRHGSTFSAIEVFGFYNPISGLATWLARRAGWPLVLHPFGTLSKYSYSHRRRWLKALSRAALDKPALHEADAIHFTTVLERDEAAWHGIHFGDRAFVIPPPVTLPHRPRQSLSERQIAAPVVSVLARLHPVKNLEILLDAWPLIVRRIPHAQLRIAGSGDPGYVRALHQRAAAAGLDPSECFVGFLKENARDEFLVGADVVALPSFHENFGLGVAEALAAGIPVVTTEEVQLASFIREHAFGAVAVRSPEAFASGITEVLGDIALRDHCRRLAPGVVREKFGETSIGRQLRDMYAGLRPNESPYVVAAIGHDEFSPR